MRNILVIVALVFVVLAVGSVFLNQPDPSPDEFEKTCREHGGHIVYNDQNNHKCETE